METQMLMFLAMCSAISPKELIQLCGPLHPTAIRYALVKYGGGVIQMSGSIAGNTFARNRFGNYVRSRTKPVNPNSDRQVQARSIIAQLAEQWGETPMTAAIRIAWGIYAAAIAMQNKLGETIHLSGFNHFVRSNAAILACGGTLVTAAPTVLSLPATDPSVAVTGSASGAKLSVAFDDALEWLDEAGGYLEVEMGMPQKDSRNFFGGPFRFADSVDGNDTTPPTTPTEIDPPFTLVEGQKVWCRTKIIRADGRISTGLMTPPFAVSA